MDLSFETLSARVAACATPADAGAVAGLYRTFPDMATSTIAQRYGEYLAAQRAAGQIGIEQLVPWIAVPHAPSRAAGRAAAIPDDRARALLAAHPAPGWGYHFPLSPGHSTLGPTDPAAEKPLSQRRSEHRLSFILGGLEQVLGSLAGLSVLDIACNWGGFAVEALLRGAGPVTGFDIRPGNIAKAQHLAAHFGVEVTWQASDLFAFPTAPQYDVVLNLGLMYHLSQPWEMMQRTHALTRHVAVIDTIVHREPFSGFILGDGRGAVGHAATAVGMELHPTWRALIDLARLAGFREVVEIKGIPAPDWAGFAQDPYGNGTRRCILALK